MQYYLGCDVSKKKIDVALIDHNGVELWYDQVLNDTASLCSLILTLVGNYPDDDIRIVVESTACYHYSVIEASEMCSTPCIVYNPIMTKQQTKSTVRGKKTDKTDAVIIARIGLQGGGRVHVGEPYMLMKQLVRSSVKLTELSCSLKLHSKHIQDTLHDEFSPEAKDMIVSIQTAISQAKLQLYKDMQNSVNKALYQLLQSIKGVGPCVAATLIGELQDIHRFKSSKALIAFAGLDPKIKQSGHTLNSTGKLTKRGSSYLRSVKSQRVV
jgi:transposase